MENKVDLTKEPAVGTIEAGNNIYRVFVQDIPGLAVGDYTVTTGPNHPLGAGRNLLFGSGSPGTSFNTFRSYTTMTDYTWMNYQLQSHHLLKLISGNLPPQPP